jgi:hypothetical protein
MARFRIGEAVRSANAHMNVHLSARINARVTQTASNISCWTTSLWSSSKKIVWKRRYSMAKIDTPKGLIRDPLEWAADCQARAAFDIEVEAQDAFKQLAEEFEAAASEIEGLVSTFQALLRRKVPNPAPQFFRRSTRSEAALPRDTLP